MTHAEISEALGIPRQTVQYIEKQAMKNFKRKWLAKYPWPKFDTDDGEHFTNTMNRLRERGCRSIILDDLFDEEGVT